MFIAKHYFTEYTNITTKLKQKLFTKLIKMPSKEAWVVQTGSLIKREARALLIEIGVEKLSQK
jgi:hypothetical protein